MNKNSYFYLAPLIFGGMLTISLFFTWKCHIYNVIFFKTSLQNLYIISSLILASITSLGIFLFKANLLTGELIRTIKVITSLPLTLFIAYLLILNIPLSLLIYLPDGNRSTYTAEYKKSSGGRRGCRGIEIFEPELNREIEICYSGGASDKGLVRIYKTSNSNGIIITGAALY